jgi:hypothetical protein
MNDGSTTQMKEEWVAGPPQKNFLGMDRLLFKLIGGGRAIPKCFGHDKPLRGGQSTPHGVVRLPISFFKFFFFGILIGFYFLILNLGYFFVILSFLTSLINEMGFGK